MELLLLTLLLAKHTVMDYFMQKQFMFKDKHVYGGVGGVAHATFHALGAAIVLIWFNPLWALPIALLDGVVHYHIDYCKSKWMAKHSPTHDDPRFWWAFGIDQFAHFLTYVLMTVLALGLW
jgi:hypothetical protein